MARRIARRNPPATVEQTRTIAGKRAYLLSGRVRALEYVHAASAQPLPYIHRFRPGVELWVLEDGALLLRGARGQRLWDTFIARDDA